MQEVSRNELREVYIERDYWNERAIVAEGNTIRAMAERHELETALIEASDECYRLCVAFDTLRDYPEELRVGMPPAWNKHVTPERVHPADYVWDVRDKEEVPS